MQLSFYDSFKAVPLDRECGEAAQLQVPSVSFVGPGNAVTEVMDSSSHPEFSLLRRTDQRMEQMQTAGARSFMLSAVASIFNPTSCGEGWSFLTPGPANLHIGLAPQNLKSRCRVFGLHCQLQSL